MRKKKETRKYKPKNEFRKNHSPLTKGHPHYIFAETETKYKSFGITHNAEDSHKKYALKKNPDPKDATPAYLRTKVQTAKKDYYGEPLKGWEFDTKDKAVVKSMKRKYLNKYMKPKNKKR